MLLEQLTAEQLHGWRLYYDHEPWGEDRDDARALYLSNRINAAWGGKLPYRERSEYDRCIVEQYQEPPPTVEEIQQIIDEVERELGDN